jgi:adenosyl cobinamide kinase/adenosyl cobinamide phosphate guanylyltransferase
MDKSNTSGAGGEMTGAPVPRTHGRKVSFGDLVLPTLKKELPGMNSDTSSVSSRKINLSDVITSRPVENEAQTHLMRAIDKLKNAPIKNEDKETESLFRDIAAEEISRASIEENGQDVLEPAPSIANDQGTQDNISQQQSQRSTVVQSPVMRSRFKNLVKKQMGKDSVEQTLFGLTSALSELEKEHKKEHKRDGSFSRDASLLSSADKLDKTANVLIGNATGNKIDIESQLPDIEENTSENSETESDEGNEKQGSAVRNGKGRRHKFRDTVTDGIEDNWHVFSQFFNPRKAQARAYVRKVFMFIMLPSLAIAALLFYLVENPSLCEAKVPQDELAATEAPAIEFMMDDFGNMTNTTVPPAKPEIELFVCPGLGASASWWVFFSVIPESYACC